MRILQVYKDIFPEVAGGIERYIHDLSLFLRNRGHHVEVLVSGGGKRNAGGLEVTGSMELGRIFSNPVSPDFAGILRRTRAEVVHFHLPLPTAVLSWLISGRSGRIPYVVTYHSDIVRQAFAMPLYSPFLRSFLSRASTVLATSQRYLSGSKFLRELNNSAVIPIGVDELFFRPVKDPSRDFFLFAGRFRNYKGIDVLLDAWSSMDRCPRLIMVGGGVLEGHVRKESSARKLPVEILTDVEDEELRDLYANAAALILPSTRRSEAYGMVQLEAMSCGTPVICSDLDTGVTWVNVHGSTGLHFRTGDPLDLARAVMTIAEDPSLSGTLGDAARKRIKEGFRRDPLFERVEACLSKAATG